MGARADCRGAQILAIGATRKERAVTCGRDRTCRLWKVSEDSQLVFHAAATAGSLECAALVGANEWVTGATDGSLARWAASPGKAQAFDRAAWVLALALAALRQLDGNASAQLTVEAMLMKMRSA